MITTAHVYATLFIHLGVILIAAAYFVVSVALFPRLATASVERLTYRTVRTLLIGLAVSVPWVIAAAALMSAGGPLGLLGVILGISWVLVGLVGGGGLALVIGRAGGVDDGAWPSHGSLSHAGPADADSIDANQSSAKDASSSDSVERAWLDSAPLPERAWPDRPLAGHAWPDRLGADGWTIVARGGIALGLTWALPIAGWFVAMPLTLVLGIGCVVSSLGARSRPRAVVAARPTGVAT